MSLALAMDIIIDHSDKDFERKERLFECTQLTVELWTDTFSDSTLWQYDDFNDELLMRLSYRIIFHMRKCAFVDLCCNDDI